MIVHPGSDDHLPIRKFIYKGLLSSLLKEQQHGKVSLNNVVLGIDYKLLINMLMKQFYIAVGYYMYLPLYYHVGVLFLMTCILVGALVN